MAAQNKNWLDSVFIFHVMLGIYTAYDWYVFLVCIFVIIPEVCIWSYELYWRCILHLSCILKFVTYFRGSTKWITTVCHEQCAPLSTVYRMMMFI